MSSRAYRQYQLEPVIGEPSVTVGSHTVKLTRSDGSLSPSASPSDLGPAPHRVLLDHRVVAGDLDSVDSRDSGYARSDLVWITTQQDHTRHLAAVQRVPSASGDFYRTLLFDGDGSFQETSFPASGRAPTLRDAILIRIVAPVDPGIANTSLSGWPGLPYPVLYPFTTCVVGVVTLAIAIFRRRRPARARLNATLRAG